MSVKVGVRVRPFNQRENALKTQNIVIMNNKSTTLKHQTKQHTFTFDYSFWSFDQFKQTNQGYLQQSQIIRPTSQKYTDQNRIFQLLGKDVLANSKQGYNCCLFAYGQTGSGKSYSMIGYGANRGIIPMTCQQLFREPSQQLEVHFSMLQIYNQVIQDLLVDVGQRPSKGLKIRQNSKLGVYVEGIQKRYIDSYAGIQKLMKDGNRNRTVAATQMNATSSRAHTIVTLYIKVSDAKTTKLSTINLIDLAGSQRQQKTGASGQRLKEAIGINQSLTTLGQVISALADVSQGKKVFVPYRNSSLTRMLQDALGGNSKTVMVCALSPAKDNFQQTLSTLRYANSAKKIKNKPIVNQTQTDKLIRQLKQQNQRLKKLLEQKPQNNPNLAMLFNKKTQLNKQKKQDQQQIKTIQDEPISYQFYQKFTQGLFPGKKRRRQKQLKTKQEEEDQYAVISNTQKQVEATLQQFLLSKIQKKDQENHKSKMNYEKAMHSFFKPIIEEQKKQQSISNMFNLGPTFQTIHKPQKRIQLKKKLDSIPFLLNINRDQYLNRKVKFYFIKGIYKLLGKSTVGKVNTLCDHDIIVCGRDVKKQHAYFTKRGYDVFLTPSSYDCDCYINGTKIDSQTKLYYCDRIVFGINSVFLYKNKLNKVYRENKRVNAHKINWRFIREEMEPIDIDQTDEEIEGCGCQVF